MSTGAGARRQVRPSPDASYAVLLPLLDHEGEECVLLTRRADHLTRFAGHVSFPGGAQEQLDGDLLATALREAQEEVGIPQSQVRLRCELGWFTTGLGHRVKPFVGEVVGRCGIVPDPTEVASVIYLPTRIVSGDPFRERGRFRDTNGREHPVYTMDFQGHEIWGLTARILRSYFVEGVGRED